MAKISIWGGSSSFFPGDTPFGFYDNDSSFQGDAEKVANWCAQRLGYPQVDIELQPVNFFTCFEEAVNEYGTQLYNFQIINSFHTLEGNTTGSNFNNKLITPNLDLQLIYQNNMEMKQMEQVVIMNYKEEH